MHLSIRGYQSTKATITSIPQSSCMRSGKFRSSHDSYALLVISLILTSLHTSESHNLNMAHSGGLDKKIYTDHTCVMGNPLFSDDVGRM
jgi:hypothetical protein